MSVAYNAYNLQQICPQNSVVVINNLPRITTYAAQEGGGATLIFSYTRRLRPFLGVQKFNFSMFWVFQRNEYFWGYEDFVDILGVYHIIGLYLRVISIHFRVFSFGQGT